MKTDKNGFDVTDSLLYKSLRRLITANRCVGLGNRSDCCSSMTRAQPTEKNNNKWSKTESHSATYKKAEFNLYSGLLFWTAGSFVLSGNQANEILHSPLK